MQAAHLAVFQFEAFVAHEILGKAGIVGTNWGGGLDHFCTAEKADLQPVFGGPGTQQRIDKLFHRMGAVFHFPRGTRIAAGQKKMVHPADAGDRVVEHGRNAGSQHAKEAIIGIGRDAKLALFDIEEVAGRWMHVWLSFSPG